MGGGNHRKGQAPPVERADLGGELVLGPGRRRGVYGQDQEAQGELQGGCGSHGKIPSRALAGLYACSGKDGEGNAYHGAAVVRQIGEAYLVEWTAGQSTGIGQRNGDTLAVGWTNARRAQGITVYRIGPGPRLAGQWLAMPGKGKKCQETLEFLKALPPEEDP